MLIPSLFITTHFVGNYTKVENLRFSSFLIFRFLFPTATARSMQIQLLVAVWNFPSKSRRTYGAPTFW